MLELLSIGAICLFLALAMCFKIKRNDGLFDIESTNALRGFWSIVVILVHIPLLYQNRYQDMIGSFAYIGVTYFFMISAFGLQCAYLKKGKESLKGFWPRRLIKLIIPSAIVAIITSIVKLIFSLSFSWTDLIFINKWVLQLILFYLFYWIVYKFCKVENKYKVAIVSALACIWGLLSYFFGEYLYLSWSTESFGFAYGLIFAYNYDKIKEFINKKNWLTLGVALIASLVLGVLYLKFKSVYFIGGFCLKVLLGMAITITIIAVNKLFKFSNPINKFLGKISYETYLLHGTIFMLLSNIIIRANVTVNSGIYILAAVTLTIIGSYLINLLSNFITSKLEK